MSHVRPFPTATAMLLPALAGQAEPDERLNPNREPEEPTLPKLSDQAIQALMRAGAKRSAEADLPVGKAARLERLRAELRKTATGFDNLKVDLRRWMKQGNKAAKRGDEKLQNEYLSKMKDAQAHAGAAAKKAAFLAREIAKIEEEVNAQAGNGLRS